MTRRIVKMCRRCLGTGWIARHRKGLVYCKCPRCSGKGGKVKRDCLPGGE